MSAGFIIDSPCGRQWFLPREAVRQDYVRFLVEYDGITTEQAEAKIAVDEPFVATWFKEQYIWEEVDRDGTLLTATPPPPYLEALNFMRGQLTFGPQWRATPADAMPATSPALPIDEQLASLMTMQFAGKTVDQVWFRRADVVRIVKEAAALASLQTAPAVPAVASWCRPVPLKAGEEKVRYIYSTSSTKPQDGQAWEPLPLAPSSLAPAAPRPGCQCAMCVPQGSPFDETRVNIRMILCATCGNKRCPHAADHRNACTQSNLPGQPGSRYP